MSRKCHNHRTLYIVTITEHYIYIYIYVKSVIFHLPFIFVTVSLIRDSRFTRNILFLRLCLMPAPEVMLDVIQLLVLIIVPQHEKTYLLTCSPNEDSNQPLHRLISLLCPHGETLHPWLSSKSSDQIAGMHMLA